MHLSCCYLGFVNPDVLRSFLKHILLHSHFLFGSCRKHFYINPYTAGLYFANRMVAPCWSSERKLLYRVFPRHCHASDLKATAIFYILSMAWSSTSVLVEATSYPIIVSWTSQPTNHTLVSKLQQPTIPSSSERPQSHRRPSGSHWS